MITYLDTLIHDFPFDTDQFSYIQCNMRMDLEHFRSSIDLITEDGMISFGMDGKEIYLLTNGAYYSSASFNGDISYTNWHDIKLEINWTHQADDDTYGLATLKYKETSSDTFIIKPALENIELHVADPTQINMIRIRNRVIPTDDYAANVDNISYYSETITLPDECPSGDLNLTQQSDVTAFLDSFPTCDTIFGNLTIGAGVTDLTGLSAITYIQGNFRTNTYQLTTLEGLNQLTAIGGNLEINNASYGGDFLNNISALSAVVSVGGNIIIRNNQSITTLDGLQNILSIGGSLEIVSNPNLNIYDAICPIVNEIVAVTNITATNNATGCASIQQINFSCDPDECPNGSVTFSNQAEIDLYLSSFSTCDTIFGNLIIQGSANDISGLINLIYIQGNLRIINNSSLNSIQGLGGLTAIGGNLQIINADALTNLQGLQNLTTVDGLLEVSNNNLLADCSSICQLINNATIGGSTSINNNPSACSSVNEVTLLCGNTNCPSGSITLNNQIDVNAFVQAYPTCDTTFGNLTIQGSVNDIAGLSNLVYIQGNLRIVNNSSLNSIQGLNGLTAIGGNLQIINADVLTNLQGLQNLTTVDGLLEVSNNNLLADCSILCNLINSDGIIGNLVIANNPSACTLAEVMAICAIVPNDIAIESLFAPSATNPFLPGASEVKIVLLNHGSDTLYSAEVNWLVNNVAQPNASWAGVLFPEQRDTFVLGNYTFESTLPYTIQAFASNTNGLPDNHPEDDEILVEDLYAALSGVYTIGGGNPDFYSITDAVTALNIGGVYGPVIMNIRDGNYFEQISINAISGASTTNTILFQSQSLDKTKVTLNYEKSNTFGRDHVLHLNGTDHISFEHMTIEALNEFPRKVILINNGTQNVAFRHNLIQYPEFNSEGSLLTVENNPNNQMLEFQANEFNWGRIGLQLTFCDDLDISNNHFTNQSVIGLNASNISNVLIQKNRIDTYVSQNFTGMHLDGGNSPFNLNKNQITNATRNGIVIANINGTLIDPIQINNNFIHLTGSQNGEGLLLSEGAFHQLYYNSINVVNDQSESTALEISEGNNVTLLNNILANQANGYAIILQNNNAVIRSDFNDLFTDGTQLANLADTAIPDLNSWTTATGKDLNSKSVRPLFLTPTDPHNLQKLLDGEATVISSISDDIDDESRTTFPDIGADEYELISDDIGMFMFLDTLSACEIGNEVPVTVTILNYSGEDLSGFDVAYQLDNQPSVIENIGNLVIPAGSTVNYTFTPTIDLSTDGLYKLKAFTNYDMDTNPVNDTIFTMIENALPIGSIVNTLPTDGDTIVGTSLTFSWSPVNNATNYDLFWWPLGGTKPAFPQRNNISQITTTINGFVPSESYQWQITAQNNYCLDSNSVQIVTMEQLPNLVVDSIFIPQEGFSGQQVEISWQIKNIGEGPTDDQLWEDRIYLSEDTIYQSSQDIFLGSKVRFSALEPNGDGYFNSRVVTLPNSLEGFYYLLIEARGDLPETSKIDNWNHSDSIMTLYLTPYTDLRVTEVVPPINPFSGDSTNIFWTVTNGGLGQTLGDVWYDDIYVNTAPNLNQGNPVFLGRVEHQGILERDSSYTGFIKAPMPLFTFGPHYIIVKTDVSNQIYELGSEGNNVSASDTFEIFLAQIPDLVVSDSETPTYVNQGEKVTISWTVKNQGITAAPGSWRDYIYISPIANDTLFEEAILLENKKHIGTLDLNQIYTQTAEVTIPVEIGGNYYFYIITDADEDIFESTGEDNNQKVIPVTVGSPDLSVVNVSGSNLNPGSGDTIAISWTIVNEDDQAFILDREWTNQIYLSASTTLDPLTATLLNTGSVSPGIFMPNDSLSLSESVVIPNGLNGQHYLFVVTDTDDVIFEENIESNNTSTLLVLNISLSPWPDLAAQSITPDATGQAGTPLSFNYSVINNGEPLENKNWRDRVYISDDFNWNEETVTSLRGFNISTSLNNGESYTRSATVTLPGNLSTGNYYIHLVADDSDDLYEYTDTLNNILTSQAVFITSYPPIDLAVTAATTTSTNFASGQSIFYAWSVQNLSPVPTIYNEWEDGLYLSQDTTWDNTDDILIGGVTNTFTLNPDSTYQRNSTATIPNGISGSYYLLVVTDYNNVHNDVFPWNNYKVITDTNGEINPTEITLTASPDLVVTNFTAPTESEPGQPIDVSFTIRNQGDTIVTTNWRDLLILSDDPNYPDLGDQVLAQPINSIDLEIGATYNVNLTVNIPNNVIGNKFLLLKTDGNNNVYEHNAEDNNLITRSISIQNPPASDLVVNNISFTPATALPGAPINVTWTVQNISDNLAEGMMKEAVFLSADPVWDIGDFLLGTFNSDIQLASNEEVIHNLDVNVAGVPVGNYYLIVRTDILDNLHEENDENNNGVSFTTLEVSVKELYLDITANDVLQNSVPLYYRLEIPAEFENESLLLSLAGDLTDGANELYISYGEIPTRSNSDYSYSTPFLGGQEIIIPELTAGTYYLLAYGNTISGVEQAVTLDARILYFELVEIDDNQGGNTGSVTVKLRGAKFDPDMALAFVDSDGNQFSGSVTTFWNQTLAFATFDLRGATPGLYDILATNTAGDQLFEEDVFTVVEGVPDALGIELVMPAGIRDGSSGSFRIEFANNGNVDLDNPSAFVESLYGSFISTDLENINAQDTRLEVPLRELNGPPDILRPGASGVIYIYAKANTFMTFMVGEVD